MKRTHIAPLLSAMVLILSGALAAAHTNHGKKTPTVAEPTSAKEAGHDAEPVADKDASDDGADLGDFEEVEEIVDLDALDDSEIGGAAPTQEPRGLGWLIGYFHSAAVHLPIAWVLLLLTIDIVALLLGRRELLPAGYFLALFAALSFLPAALSGFLRFDSLNLSGPDSDPALLHRNIELVAAALMISAAGLRLSTRNNLAGGRRNLYLALLIAAAIAVSYGSHLGGQMIFGPIAL